jgi:hypothetical protein
MNSPQSISRLRVSHLVRSRRVWFFCAIQVVAIAAQGSDVETIEFWFVVLPHSAATCAPFSATERFMKKTRTISATAITAKRKNVSK